jgi:hypothetical protein
MSRFRLKMPKTASHQRDLGSRHRGARVADTTLVRNSVPDDRQRPPLRAETPLLAVGSRTRLRSPRLETLAPANPRLRIVCIVDLRYPLSPLF